MEIKKIAKYVGIGIITVILIAFVSMGFITYDVMSYTATGSETLNPAGNQVGKALVVYDPSIKGTAKNAATVIAGELQAKGYTVDLAGIRSETAANTSGYNVIVVGGPIYVGTLGSSVQSYLNALKPPENVKIGVFTTGMIKENSTDDEFIRKEIALPSGSTFQINTVVKMVDGDDTNQKAIAFVNALLD